MNNFHITRDQLEKAKLFFRESSIDKLTAISIKINTEQPNFTGVLLALQMHGLDRIKVEDLLESVFIVYYAQTFLNKKSIRTISSGQVAENVKLFGQFIDYFNREKSDSAQIKFLRDEIVLHFAVETLHNLFGDIKDVPIEVVFGYFALLKGIEIGAEKSS